MALSGFTYKKHLLATGLLLASLLSLLHYHHRRLQTAGIQPLSDVRVQPQSSPDAMLREANRLSWLQNWAAAAPLYTAAENGFKASGSTRNELYARVGRIRAQFDQLSFEQISTSLGEILRNPVTLNDPQLKLWCLVNKGYADLEIDLSAAQADWTEARNIAIQSADSRWAIRASGELGVVAFLQGNTSVAAAKVGQALFSTMAHGDIGGEIRFSDMIGTGLNEIHRYSEALPFFNQVIRLADRNPDVGFPFMAHERRAEALLELGRQQEAQAELHQVLSEAEAEQRQGPKMQALILMSRLQILAGDRGAALKSLETAQQIAVKLAFYRMVACAMYDAARLYDSMGEVRKAEESEMAAIQASRRVGDRFFVPRDLSALASLKAQEGEIKAADSLFEEAEDVVDGMLVNMHVPFWKSGLGAAMSQIYIRHFRLIASTGNADKALQVLERVRGRTIAATLQDREPAARDVSAASLPIEDEISSLQINLMREQRKPEREELLEKLLDYERRLILMENDSALSHREFLGKPATLRAVQRILRNDEVLLEYVLDEPRSFCISVSRDKASIDRLPGGSREIEKLVQQYLSVINEKKPDTAITHQLYSILLGPIAMQRQKLRLIIAPDGVLRKIPFEGLREDDGRYLIRSHIVSYTPAATVLEAIRKPSQIPAAPRALLAVGDVPYEDMPDSPARRGKPRSGILRGLYDLGGVRLGRLPETREEVVSIGKSAGDDTVLLLGRDASESMFKAQSLRDFKVIHMAVHALVEPGIPERSALVLSGDPASRDDGLLQIREITQLHLNAELVTLSACDTNVGALEGEAGASTLVEAFLVAGAKSVVASLWAVDDVYTAALMARFYDHLSAGLDKASALRQAKLDMMEKYGADVSPLYWASFVLTGDGGSSVSFHPPSAHN